MVLLLGSYIPQGKNGDCTQLKQAQVHNLF